MNSELDHIQLSPLLIGELYKDTLVLSPEPALAIQPTQAPEPAMQRPAEPAIQPKQAPEPAMQRPAEPAIQRPSEATAVKPAPLQRKPEPTPQPQSAPESTRQPAAVQPAPEPADTPQYKFLGKNSRKITILVQTPGVPFLPDNQLNFLTKILEACRMNIGDVAIVNTATSPVNIGALRRQLEPAVVLLFGLDPTSIKLPINFPVFKIQPYDNCSYLSAPPLTQLVQQSEESKLLKSKLWVCLKSLFNV